MWASEITVDGDCSREIKRCLCLGRKVMTNLDSILKRRDITLSTKVKSESEVAQLCPTLCDPMDCSLSGSSVHGIFQARELQWVAISFPRGSSQTKDQTWVSRIVGTICTREVTSWQEQDVNKGLGQKTKTIQCHH